MRILEWCSERFGEGDIFSASFGGRYNEAVREVVKEKGGVVLEFRAEDGWGPLCGFLGREVPGGLFPRVNEKRTFAVIRWVLVLKGLVSWVLLGGLVWFGCKYMLGLFV